MSTTAKPTHQEAISAARMSKIVENLPSNAAKIRALDREGFERGSIAKFLGVRYQQVYNVLKRSKVDEYPPEGGCRERLIWAKIGPAGRVSIPASYLEALGLREGDDVQLELADRELRLVPKNEAIARVQSLVIKHVPKTVSLVDELIVDRRREAVAEEEGS